jgi:hypothetical protein
LGLPNNNGKKFTFDALFLHLSIFILYMATKGKPYKEDKDKKVKYGISIDRYLFDKMKEEKVSVSKFIQILVKEYYEKV